MSGRPMTTRVKLAQPHGCQAMMSRVKLARPMAAGRNDGATVEGSAR